MLKALTRTIGNTYETLALNYLKNHGLSLVQKNYSTKLGEIDIIALEGDILCFIEVRFRKSIQYGGAALSVTPKKQSRIKKAASQFLVEHARFRHSPCRFDVISIHIKDNQPQIDWIASAFY